MSKRPWADVVKTVAEEFFPDHRTAYVEHMLKTVLAEIAVKTPRMGQSITVPGVGTFYPRTRAAHTVVLKDVEFELPEQKEIGFRASKGKR